VKRRLLDHIVCPDCESALSLETDDLDEVIDGMLICGGCSREFPVIAGIPRLLPSHISPDKRETAARFGWEWKYFVEMHEEHHEQFLDWIHPIEPAFFEGKIVLDAGCGIGRHTGYAADFGAREVIGMDLSEAVETAYRNVGHLPNVHIVQGDIYNPPFRRGGNRKGFDFVYSIGVIHHLPDPQSGFESLVRLIKPGGAIFAWVYGQENNAVVHHFIDPLRRTLTRRLPPRLLLVLSWPLAALMHGIVKGVYRPLRDTPVAKLLPSRVYLTSLAAFTFRQNHGIVFDHLTAPTAFYIKGPEFRSWFHKLGLEDLEFSWRNENSWRGRGRVPVRAELMAVPGG
jgi:SAM-dependent methyltransferase